MHNTITKHRPTCQRHKDAYRLRKYAQGAADAASIDLWALARLRDSSALPLIAQLQRTKMLSPKILLKARALISDGRQLLLCWEKRHQFFLLPGGTLEPAEALKDCLGRELREELGIDTEESCLAPLSFGGEGNLLILLYVCRKYRGIPTPLEGQTLAWVQPDALMGYDLCPADRPLAAAVRDLLTG